MRALAERILTLDRDLAAAKSQHDATVLQRQIDELVYELYELTENEVAIVEDVGIR